MIGDIWIFCVPPLDLDISIVLIAPKSREVVDSKSLHSP